MITLDEIGKKRQKDKLPRGPWPNERAEKEWLYEAVKELSDAYEYLKLGYIHCGSEKRAEVNWAIENIHSAFKTLRLNFITEIEELFRGSDEPEG